MAALLAFLARTPLKIDLVDTSRRRRLARTRLAGTVLAIEVGLAAVLVLDVALQVSIRAWWPLLLVVPLVSTELWFDMRSRSRRLVLELCGAVGIAAVAPIAVLVDGKGGGLAAAIWLVLAARPITAIVLVREQVRELHGRGFDRRRTLVADVIALAVAASAVVVDAAVLARACAIAAAIAVQRLLQLWPAKRAVVLGIRQSVIGIAVSIVLGMGVVL